MMFWLVFFGLLLLLFVRLNRHVILNGWLLLLICGQLLYVFLQPGEGLVDSQEQVRVHLILVLGSGHYIKDIPRSN